MRIKEFLVAILRLFLEYFFLFVTLVVVCAPFCLLARIRRWIAFSAMDVIATSDPTSMIWGMIFVLYIAFTALSVYLFFFPNNCELYYMDRFFYGSRRAKRKYIGLWFVGLLVSMLLSIPGLFGRICLTDDGRIQRYNVWNQLTEEISSEDITSVALKTHQKDRGAGYDYSIRFFDAEENDYWFSRGEFRFSDEKTLQSLLDIKSLYTSEQITVNGVEHLEQVVQGCELSEEETVLLYELFVQTP